MARTPVKRVFGGVLELRVSEESGRTHWVVNWARVAVVSGSAVLAIYALGVGAGYYWFHVKRGLDVRLTEVATFQRPALARASALKLVEETDKAWRGKKWREAYFLAKQAQRVDPTCEAAIMGKAVAEEKFGQMDLARETLERGLAVVDAPSLELLRRYATLLRLAGAEADLRTWLEDESGMAKSALPAPERQRLLLGAILATEGASAAGTWIERHSAVRADDGMAPLLARVAWEQLRVLEAIEILRAHVARADAAPSAAGQLIDYLISLGLKSEAESWAWKLGERFPASPLPYLWRLRLLRDRQYPSAQFDTLLGAYGQRFDSDPVAKDLLFSWAANCGWDDVILGVMWSEVRTADSLFQGSLYYAACLLNQQMSARAALVLSDLEKQAPADPQLRVGLQRLQERVRAGGS